MTPISVVIITYNEERNIGRCLASLKEVADDIVVVDSFSTDRTKEICMGAGVRFIEHTFEGHIQQKNWAVTQAQFPHVLSLDADEALSDRLRQSITEAKNHFDADGYTMNRLTSYCGKWIYHCGWYPDIKLRLWDSSRGGWTGINPHDRYEMVPGSRIKHLSGDILHYSYYTRDDHFRQIDYFTSISANEYFRMGKKSHVIIRMGSPVVKFIRDYFLHLGILDGMAGFQISYLSAYGAWLKYKKLNDLWKKQ